MRSAVRAAFVPFTVPLEGGYIDWMFPDVLGFVSTGFGLLLDPVQAALGLPWRRKDGSVASRDEIIADFNRVKTFPDAARLGHRSVEHVAQLRVAHDDLDKAVQWKIEHNELFLKRRFPDFEEWPADAQLGTLSMAWACGPAFRFPKLEAALKERDFEQAAIECFMPQEATIGGLRPRNKANRVLFQNAAIVAVEMDPDVLYWPRDLTRIGVDPAPPTPRNDTPFAIVHPDVPLPKPDPPDDAA